MTEIYEVKITTQAQKQMVEIIDYISHELFAPDAANNLLDKMEENILALSEFPERYQLIDEEPRVRLRSVVVSLLLLKH